MESDAILLVNFGGPRTLDEVPSFLKELLLDRDVIRTPLPYSVQRFLFKRIAKKRSVKVAEDYREIGGRSPIYEDTERVAIELKKRLGMEVVTFHRYLKATHHETLDRLRSIKAKRWIAIPLFPQFSYATTGSIARFLSEMLPSEVVKKLHWIRSYPDDHLYIEAMKGRIDDFLIEKKLLQEEVFFLFSAHGLPKQFVEEGDPYEKECQKTFKAIQELYPKARSMLSYQSKFGRGEWLRPYTDEVCEEIERWAGEGKAICIIPMSFTSDHIETLYEIEKLYVEKIKEKGINAYRVPALNLRDEWMQALSTIALNAIENDDFKPNEMLIRPPNGVREEISLLRKSLTKRLLRGAT